MNPLRPNPETGFLETSPNYSPDSGKPAFNSDQKLKFLQYVRDCIDAGKYPLIHEICREVGVTIRTFELHIKADSKFKTAWEEVRKQLLSVFTGKLAFKADQKYGTLANLAMLRYLETGTWQMNGAAQPLPNISPEMKQAPKEFVYIDGEIIENPPEITDNPPKLPINSKPIDNQSDTSANNEADKA